MMVLLINHLKKFPTLILKGKFNIETRKKSGKGAAIITKKNTYLEI